MEVSTELLNDRFQVMRQIGQGGQARTYLAHDLQTDQDVVVKELSFEHADDWKSVVNISTDTKNLKQKNVANAPHNFSDEAKTSCALFCSLLERNGVPTPAKESKTYVSWLTEFDRLLRIGPPGANRGVSADDVKRVMLFAVNDEFWSSNVLSAKKLRQHFVRLQLQQRKVKGSGGIGTGGVA